MKEQSLETKIAVVLAIIYIAYIIFRPDLPTFVAVPLEILGFASLILVILKWLKNRKRKKND